MKHMSIKSNFVKITVAAISLVALIHPGKSQESEFELKDQFTTAIKVEQTPNGLIGILLGEIDGCKIWKIIVRQKTGQPIWGFNQEKYINLYFTKCPNSHHSETDWTTITGAGKNRIEKKHKVETQAE